MHTISYLKGTCHCGSGRCSGSQFHKRFSVQLFASVFGQVFNIGSNMKNRQSSLGGPQPNESFGQEACWCIAAWIDFNDQSIGKAYLGLDRILSDGLAELVFDVLHMLLVSPIQVRDNHSTSCPYPQRQQQRWPQHTSAHISTHYTRRSMEPPGETCARMWHRFLSSRALSLRALSV